MADDDRSYVLYIQLHEDGKAFKVTILDTDDFQASISGVFNHFTEGCNGKAILLTPLIIAQAGKQLEDITCPFCNHVIATMESIDRQTYEEIERSSTIIGMPDVSGYKN